VTPEASFLFVLAGSCRPIQRPQAKSNWWTAKNWECWRSYCMGW